MFIFGCFFFWYGRQCFVYFRLNIEMKGYDNKSKARAQQQSTFEEVPQEKKINIE